MLGLDPLSDHWSSAAGGSEAEGALAPLVEALLAQRQEARAAKDFATADRVRDQLAAATIDIEDTAHGPRWSVRKSEH